MYSHLALSENGFLFDSQSGKTFNLNSTGVFLLRQLINGEEPSNLGFQLAMAFKIDSARALQDVDEFVIRLLELHVFGDKEEN